MGVIENIFVLLNAGFGLEFVIRALSNLSIHWSLIIIPVISILFGIYGLKNEERKIAGISLDSEEPKEIPETDQRETFTLFVLNIIAFLVLFYLQSNGPIEVLWMFFITGGLFVFYADFSEFGKLVMKLKIHGIYSKDTS